LCYYPYVAFIYKNPHRQSYEAAKQELEDLARESQMLSDRLNWIGQRRQHLEASLKALLPLLEETPGQDLGDVGITEMCRMILERTHSWMTAQDVRDYLNRMGISIEGYTNPMAVLHSILRRVGSTQRGANGDIEYGARGPLPPMPRMSDIARASDATSAALGLDLDTPSGAQRTATEVVESKSSPSRQVTAVARKPREKQ